MKPFVELSFMPEALASGNKTVFHYRANVTPPKDYKRWAELVKKFTCALCRTLWRGGSEGMVLEVWNEPNLPAFWTGTQADYFKLYAETADSDQEGGRRTQSRRPGDSEERVDRRVPRLLRQEKSAGGFRQHASLPDRCAVGTTATDTESELAEQPPRHSARTGAGHVRRAGGRPVYYTEWNASSNPRDPRQDEPYAAAFVVKTVLETNGLVEAYSFWTFTDIFEENYFPSKPFHGGFGLLNLHGIPKPTYRAYELLHQLGTEQLLVDGIHETVNAWAVRKENSLTVLLTNHALPRHSIKTEQVRVRVTESAEPAAVFVQRIDEEHANPRRLWREMGEPEYLKASEIEQLQAASRLTPEPYRWKYADESVHLEIALPPHGVAAITLEYSPMPR